jgi:hypothetical protein
MTTETGDEDPYMGPPKIPLARIIKVADAKGRKQECILKISIVIHFLSDLDSDSSQG